MDDSFGRYGWLLNGFTAAVDRTVARPHHSFSACNPSLSFDWILYLLVWTSASRSCLPRASMTAQGGPLIHRFRPKDAISQLIFVIMRPNNPHFSLGCVGENGSAEKCRQDWVCGKTHAERRGVTACHRTHIGVKPLLRNPPSCRPSYQFSHQRFSISSSTVYIMTRLHSTHAARYPNHGFHVLGDTFSFRSYSMRDPASNRG